MTTILRSFADLYLLKDAVTDVNSTDETGVFTESLPLQTKVPDNTSELSSVIKEDVVDLTELESLLKQQNFWLGYSTIKGWVLLDRNHPEYTQWNYPFVLLRDGCIDRLSKEEFSKGPKGIWILYFWKNLDDKTRRLAGSPSALLPKVRQYAEQAEQQARLAAYQAHLAAQEAERHTAEIDEDLSTRINTSSHFLLDWETDFDCEEDWAKAKQEEYRVKLPARVSFLAKCMKRIQGGEVGLEPMWSQGKEAVAYLHEKGIDYLWHFTDIRNLVPIRREGGLFSYAGLKALGIADVHIVANDISRNCDERLGREHYVRLSFIPNSWFFQRVYRNSRCRLVWLRFSTQVLRLGEVSYCLGNATSSHSKCQDNLQSIDMDWKIINEFSGRHGDEKGPTQYPHLYRDEVGDDMRFGQIRDAWNSEILIKHYLSLQFCTRIFDSSTGERIKFYEL
jgi:hypothetical protein